MSESPFVYGPAQVYVESEWNDANGACLDPETGEVTPMVHLGEVTQIEWRAPQVPPKDE